MPGSKSLSDWLELLQTLHPEEIELGLKRVKSVARAMSVLDNLPVTITVAGTNGKGSCVTSCEHILSGLGFRVGSYLSPHINFFNERIRVNGITVTDEQLVAAFEHVDAARQNISLTYFEFTTLAALWVFSLARLDVIVLEVGLGGRLDAVNIVDSDVAVITSIGLDHMDWLGETKEQIASEKAGIMRPGKPCVVSDRNAWFGINSRAMEIGTPLYRMGIEFDFFYEDEQSWCWRGAGKKSYKNLPRNAGSISEINIATALQACLLSPLDIDPVKIKYLLNNINLAGRCEVRQFKNRQMIFDVGHNAHAGEFVSRQLILRNINLPLVGVLGMLDDKEPQAFMDAFGDNIQHWYVAPLHTPRTVPPDQWRVIARDRENKVTLCSSIVEAVEFARNKHKNTVIITGSFYTVEEANCYFDSLEDA